MRSKCLQHAPFECIGITCCWAVALCFNHYVLLAYFLNFRLLNYKKKSLCQCFICSKCLILFRNASNLLFALGNGMMVPKPNQTGCWPYYFWIKANPVKFCTGKCMQSKGRLSQVQDMPMVLFVCIYHTMDFQNWRIGDFKTYESCHPRQVLCLSKVYSSTFLAFNNDLAQYGIMWINIFTFKTSVGIVRSQVYKSNIVIHGYF